MNKETDFPQGYSGAIKAVVPEQFFEEAERLVSSQKPESLSPDFEVYNTAGLYKGSNLLHSLALAAAGDRRSHLDKPEEFRSAIYELMDKVSKPSEKLIVSTLVMWGARLVGKREALETWILRWLIETKDRDITRKLFDGFVADVIEHLIPELDHLVEMETDENVSKDLDIIIDRLKANDPVMQAALCVEALEGTLAKRGIDETEPCKLSRGRFFEWASILIAKVAIPAFKDYDPKMLSVDLLDQLELLGLVQAARPCLFLSAGKYCAWKFGKAYQVKHFGWRAAPNPDDVTTVNYEVRRREWVAAKDEFERRKDDLAQCMALLAKQAGFGQKGREWNDGWLVDQVRSGQLQTLIPEVLEHPTAVKILAYTPCDGDYDYYDYYYDRLHRVEEKDAEDIRNTVPAISVLLAFSSRNPERYLNLIKSSVRAFYQFVLGLYGLGEEPELIF